MFLTESYKEYIDIVIKSILSNLNSIEYKFVFDKYCDLLEYIYNKLLISNPQSFIDQIKRNNNREIIAILYLFFPYIDDINNYEKFKLIKNLSDITIKKNNDTYEISNFQYSRGYDEDDSFNEYSFSIEDITINFELLKETINNLRTKFYVNWVNVVPILLEKYQESKIYKNTVKYYLENNISFKETALPFAEFYDTIINDLYLNTLDFKWLLFEKSVNDKNIMYLDILNDIYSVYNILNNIEDSKWLLLDESKQVLFIKNMDLYIDKIQKGESYNNYSNKLLKNFFIYMMTFFDTKYNFVNDVKNYKKVYTIYTSDDIYEDNEDDNFEEHITNYKSMNKFYLYDFIRSQILKLNKSWYGYKIFKNNKIIKLEEYNNTKSSKYYNQYNLNKINTKYKVSYKNIYNFSKSLFFYYKLNNAKPNRILNLTIPTNFNSLNNTEKFYISDILNYIGDIYRSSDTNYTNDKLKEIIIRYFNISNNIKTKYSEYNFKTKFEIRDVNYNLIVNVLNSITDIVFECLCKRGLLSEFIIRKNEFERSNLNSNTIEVVKISNQKLFEDHIKKYEKAYYYINDEPYSNLKKIKDYFGANESYYKYLANRMDWYNMYAMDWVSQINFYHHYLNQRIVMLTGGTGVGKSTQTPKLLLYGLKAFDKRFKGKIICTQPRIDPTTNNAERISLELGVPIKTYSSTYRQNVKTTYGIVQYKYEKDDHIDDDQDYFLRIVTDGTLLSDLQSFPLLKKIKNDSRNNLKISDKFYSLKNLYDIVIVDESHEHNANMDMILTLLRTSVFLNNQLKLYIVSATMDLDDPIYRKYYRYINDNLLYPIRDVYNAETQQFNLLDRCVIDRRIHISPPGETTQYKINEIYHTEDLEEKESYKLAIKYAEKICLENDPINKDVLLFCTTVSNIIKLVDELNQILPINTIAVPYYRDMADEFKKMISNNLKQFKRLYKYERKFIHDYLKKKKMASTNLKFKYDRVIIVSTNIAEASITINTLKFVIDTGFNNDVSYNYDTNTTNNQILKISEASRLQRKGRVGRVSDGIIYYTYPKNSRLNIIPIYGICKADFSLTFLNLMSEKEDEYGIYVSDLYPYVSNTKLNIEKEDYIELLEEEISNKEENESNDKTLFINLTLFKFLIYSQFLTTSVISEDLCFTEKLYNKNLVNSSVYDFIVPNETTGIEEKILVDANLSYYLIHPFENKYQDLRNKNTRLLDKKYKLKIDDIQKTIRKKLIFKLEQNLYVYYPKPKLLYKTKNIENLNKIKQKTKNKLLDFNLFYPIIVGYKLGVYKNILFIVNFLINTHFNILEIVSDLEVFNKYFSNKESDLLTINNIFELFKNTYKHVLFDENIETVIEKSYNDLKTDFNYYKSYNYKYIKYENFNNLINIKLKNDDLEVLNERLSEKINPKKLPDYINIEIKNWCKNYGINYLIFDNILNEYYSQYINFQYVFNVPINLEYIGKNIIEKELTFEKNIIKSFMYGNIHNIYIYKDNKLHNYSNYNSIINYKKNNYKKKWISNVIQNNYILSLSIENERLNKNSNIDADDEITDDMSILLNVLSAIDDRMYKNVLYINDNPIIDSFIKIDTSNYICNNPINFDQYKNDLDPNFNDYINNLKSKMIDYIDKNC